MRCMLLRSAERRSFTSNWIVVYDILLQWEIKNIMICVALAFSKLYYNPPWVCGSRKLCIRCVSWNVLFLWLQECDRQATVSKSSTMTTTSTTMSISTTQQKMLCTLLEALIKTRSERLPPYAVYNIGGGTLECQLEYFQTLREVLVRADMLPEDYRFWGLL